MSYRREDIRHFSIVLDSIAHAVACNHRKTQRRSKVEQGLVAALLLPKLMPLQLNINMLMAIYVGEPVEVLARCFFSTRGQCGCQRPLVTTGQTDQACGKFFQVFKCRCSLGLGPLAHLESRDELAEVLIARLRRTQQHNAWRLVGHLMRKPGCRR